MKTDKKEYKNQKTINPCDTHLPVSANMTTKEAPMTLKIKTINEMRQHGFGLLDVILASVLLLGALAGIIVLFNNASLSSNVTETGRAAATMSSEVRGLYRTSSNFDGLDTQKVIDAEIAPANLIVPGATPSDDGTIQTPFGGDSAIEIEAVTGEPEFTMTFSDLRASACERLSVAPSNAAGALGTSYEVTTIAADVSADPLPAPDCSGEDGFKAVFGR